MRIETLLPILIQSAQLERARGICRTNFYEFLRASRSQLTFITPENRPVLEVTVRSVGPLQRLLGDNFYGATFGGPLAHGLGNRCNSQVELVIYTRSLGTEDVQDKLKPALRHLKQALGNCGSLVCDLDRLEDPLMALPVFAEAIIAPANQANFRVAALCAIRNAVSRTDEHLKPQLLAAFKKEFARLSFLDPDEVTTAFMYKRAEEWVPDQPQLIALRGDHAFMDQLRSFARAEMIFRPGYCPFPKEIEVLFD
jgi:hypothetical protein